MALLMTVKQHAWKPVIAIIFIWLQYQLWFDESGVRSSMQMQNKIEEQKELNAALDARNQVLSEEIISIKSGMGSIEAKARKELGMVKEGETYFIVVKPKIESEN